MFVKAQKIFAVTYTTPESHQATVKLMAADEATLRKDLDGIGIDVVGVVAL